MRPFHSVSAIRFGPAMLPSRDSPEEAVELLLAAGYSACEIDFERRFWMDWPFAERLGELARDAGIALSVHSPLFAFVGRPERDKKHRTAIGMLDHTAGVAVACGAELVVVHPGYFFGRPREQAIASVVEQLAELRERLEGKGRAIPFGVEVMGRVRELGTLDDVLAIAARLPWVRPVIDLRTCTPRATAPTPRTSRSGTPWPQRTPRSRQTRPSISTSPTSPTPTATRPATFPTARAPCAPSRWPRRWPASSGRRR